MNKSVGYAITALVQLAADRSNEVVSNTVICQRTGMPDRYVLQILRELSRAGLVASTRGIKGGYRLAKPANQISLLDICEAVEGPFLLPQLPTDGFNATSKRLIDSVLADATDDARRRLSAVTLDKLQAAKA